jgi:hypothetical protein
MSLNEKPGTSRHTLGSKSSEIIVTGCSADRSRVEPTRPALPTRALDALATRARPAARKKKKVPLPAKRASPRPTDRFATMKAIATRHDVESAQRRPTDRFATARVMRR